jgi:hypothetical protein
LERIGLEVPEQLPALFLMDASDVENLTSGTQPLTDLFPKRLSDQPADLVETDRLAMEYMPSSEAGRRFRSSALMTRLWPEMEATADPYFVIRAKRYLAETRRTNRFEELDLYLHKFSVRTPVLEVLESDPMRLAIVKEAAHEAGSIVPEEIPDLVAGALAQHDFAKAARFLEDKRSRGTAERRDILLLAYVYCQAGEVEKAETAAATLGSDRSDPSTDWMWGKLQAEFGFRPPR